MADSRRDFLAKGTMGLVGAAIAGAALEAQTGTPAASQTTSAPPAPQTPAPQTPGATPAFGTAPPVGPVVGAATFAEAEKLVQVTLSPAERAEAAGNWQQSMAALFERRTGPRKVALRDADVPATVWDPVLPGFPVAPAGAGVTDTVEFVPRQLPTDDASIAFAPVTWLSSWIESKHLTSERLTRIYLARLKAFQPKLNCVITLCEEHALTQARAADAEIAAGKYRGALHGIPWGAKDLLDTANIATTWGAEFMRHRVPTEDATVTKRLNAAGAVLVAKLSLGALALNDIWFGGQTKNPWNLDEGASGSSAGPGAAVAAGLVGFAIGSETQGSILSPSMRCGVTGLRPTFGRVPRTGAMTLSWSCDKLGVMARGVEDTLLVLKEISGPDLHGGKGDVACVAQPLGYDGPGRLGHGVAGLRVGYIDKWMNEAPATDVDRAALATLEKLGAQTLKVMLPDWPYDSLNTILFAESAAAFEEYTLDHRMDQLKAQVPDAWPNTFRQSRFLSAVDFVQADRLRRRVAYEVEELMKTVDVLLVPSLRDDPLVIFNFTGHPALCLRAGFVQVSEERSDWAPDPNKPLKKFSPPRRVPYGVTLVGRLFDEATICRVGSAMEGAFGVSNERPAGF